jgi:predicted 3-demethylubiquinone-9 3-methyltransferase (glyoxalase superfamily)
LPRAIGALPIRLSERPEAAVGAGLTLPNLPRKGRIAVCKRNRIALRLLDESRRRKAARNRQRAIKEPAMQRISTCLWFDTQAEEAARFYVSLFPNSRIVEVKRYLEGAPRPAGSVMTVLFTLDGVEHLALNGGPSYQFSPAISLIAYCDTQEEIDVLWRKLSEGGREVQCGWLTDRYGVSWQVVPRVLLSLLDAGEKAASQRVFSAMLKMIKLDIAALQRAHRGA